MYFLEFPEQVLRKTPINLVELQHSLENLGLFYLLVQRASRGVLVHLLMTVIQ